MGRGGAGIGRGWGGGERGGGRPRQARSFLFWCEGEEEEPKGP